MRNFIKEYISTHRKCESIERTKEHNLEFSAEVRKMGRVHCDLIMRVPGSDVGMQIGKWTAHDLDWCFRDLQRNLIMFLEVKTFGKREIPYGEETLMDLFDTASFGEYTNLGSHTLVFENTCSDDSEWIEFDGCVVTKEELWDILNLVDHLEEEAECLADKYSNDS